MILGRDIELIAMFAPDMRKEMQRRIQRVFELDDAIFGATIGRITAIPVFAITFGAYLAGWRRVRWSVKRKGWFEIVASDVDSRQAIGFLVEEGTR